MPAHASDPRSAAIAVVRTLVDAGHIAYFAGGCVRDELLGLIPSDFDIATDATPDRVQALFPRTAAVGASFGVILVRNKHHTIEVATFRADGRYTDARRPDSVTFSNAHDDAARRDFTVNALFLDPLAPPTPPSPTGKVIDLVSGLADLHTKTLRAVGNPDQRLAEDHLRALRAVRLSAKLGFTIEPATADAIRRHARELKGVSRERIGDELRAMLAHPTRVHAARTLSDLTLLGPALDESASSLTPRSLTSLPKDADFPTALAALAIDLGHADPTTITRWRAALCLSNQECADVLGTTETLHRFQTDWPTLPTAQRKRLAASPHARRALAILVAISVQKANEIRSDIDQLTHTPSGLAPHPIISGDDLTALGFRPGPQFKKVLDALYDAQLEDRLRSKPEALELARRLWV